jgi:hypothetical protein
LPNAARADGFSHPLRPVHSLRVTAGADGGMTGPLPGLGDSLIFHHVHGMPTAQRKATARTSLIAGIALTPA